MVLHDGIVLERFSVTSLMEVVPHTASRCSVGIPTSYSIWKVCMVWNSGTTPHTE